MQRRKLKIFHSDIKMTHLEFEEGKNCDRIDDSRSREGFPIVKVFMGNSVRIFKGTPYEIEVVDYQDKERGNGETG